MSDMKLSNWEYSTSSKTSEVTDRWVEIVMNSLFGLAADIISDHLYLLRVIKLSSKSCLFGFLGIKENLMVTCILIELKNK